MNGEPRGQQDSTNYTRFIVLGRARTGSTLLVQALNSNPRIVCFGEVFDWRKDSVDFGADGYDAYRGDDLKLRNEDPIAFLGSRIFCEHPEPIGAVGFKLFYFHCISPWGFSGLLDYLVEDKGIKVIHLQRRNMLKSLVSSKIAARTGVGTRVRAMTRLRRILKSLRHPARAVRRARSLVVQNLTHGLLPLRVRLSVEECRAHFEATESAIKQYDALFEKHARLSLFYEDLLSNRAEVFAEAQSCLEIEPQELTAGLQKQNPDDLRALLDNYEELRDAFSATKYSEFFL